jgi:hypothetical protein
MKRALLLAATACASSRGASVEWTVKAPTIERSEGSVVLSVVAEACHDDRKMACNLALSRARALLAGEVRSLLDRLDKPAEVQFAPAPSAPRANGSAPPNLLGRSLVSSEPSDATDRDQWVQRAVAGVRPAEIWTDEGDTCSWLLARLDLTAMTRDVEAPVVAGRALENHVRSMVIPAATPAEGASCE